MQKIFSVSEELSAEKALHLCQVLRQLRQRADVFLLAKDDEDVIS